MIRINLLRKEQADQEFKFDLLVVLTTAAVIMAAVLLAGHLGWIK